MAVPADVTAHLVLIEAKIFGVFQVDLDRPACSRSARTIVCRVVPGGAKTR